MMINRDGGDEEVTYKGKQISLENWVSQQEAIGRKIAVVQGLGFVGQAMASVVATAGHSQEYGVIGVDLAVNQPKIDMINKGISPIRAADPKVEEFLKQAVLERESLIATTSKRAYAYADVIIVDVPFEAAKPSIDKVLNIVIDNYAPSDWLGVGIYRQNQPNFTVKKVTCRLTFLPQP